MKRFIYALLILIIISLIFTGCYSNKSSFAQQDKSQTNTQPDPFHSPSIQTSTVSVADTTKEKDNILKTSQEQAKTNDINTISSEYKAYLNTLDKLNIESILLGLNKFREIATNNKAENDILYTIYNEFYRNMVYYSGLDLSGESVYWGYSDEKLSQYGLERWDGDGQQLVESSSFMYDTFKDYLSGGLVEYLILQKDKNLGQFFAETYYFIGTLNDYSDSIIAWENYYNKYNNSLEYKEEVEEAKNLADIAVMDILNYNSVYNFGTYYGQKLTEDAQKCYKRFVSLYPNSSYNKIISKYYELLKKNDFVYNAESEAFLKSNGMFIKPRPDEFASYKSAMYNVANSSFIAADDQSIYFIDSLDGDKLYSLLKDNGNKTKLTDTPVLCLFLKDKWIYYSSLSKERQDDTGIFKIKVDGTENTRLSDCNASNIIVDGDFIFYILIDSESKDNGQIFRINKIDGSSKEKLNNVKTQNFVNSNVGICYTDDLNNLYKMDFDGGNNIRLVNENAKFINLDIVNDWIYYADPMKNGEVYKIKTDGTNKTRIENVFTQHGLIIKDGFLYFIDSKKLYRINMDSNLKELLLDRDLNGINLIDDWIYCKEMNPPCEMYKVQLDGSNLTKIE